MPSNIAVIGAVIGLGLLPFALRDLLRGGRPKGT